MTAVPIPQRCAGRPTQGGLVVPWISLPLADGTFDLGNMHTSKVNTCFYQRRCQICGDRILGRIVFFVPESKLDAMWAGEPPLHPECAAYSARNWSGDILKCLSNTEHDQEPVGTNPYWDIIRLLPVADLSSRSWGAHPVEIDWFRTRAEVHRTALVKTYSWSIPTPSDIAWLVTQLDGRGVVEIGAGTGYWAWQLSQAEVDVIAYDLNAFGDNTYCDPVQYHPVHRGGPDAVAGHPDRALLLCWPPYSDPMATEALSAYGGDLLVYIGEPESGCTADDDFFTALTAGWTEIGCSPRHATWWGIHDYITVFRRRRDDTE